MLRCVRTLTYYGQTYYGQTYYGHTYYGYSTYYGRTHYLHVSVELREDAALLDVDGHEQLGARHVADEEAVELARRAPPWEVARDGRLRVGVEVLLGLYYCDHTYYGSTYYGSTHYDHLHVGVEMLSEVQWRLVITIGLDQRQL